MQETIQIVGSALAGTGALVGIVFLMSNCQVKQNEAYYKLANECVAAGGSWVPSSYGQCIMGKK